MKLGNSSKCVCVGQHNLSSGICRQYYDEAEKQWIRPSWKNFEVASDWQSFY